MSDRREKLPPLLRPDGMKEKKHRESHHKRPKAQEKGVAAAVGGRKTRGSGSFEDKGDVDRADASFPLKVECKRSMGKKSIRLEAGHLTKITAEAMAQGAFPALDLQFDKEVMEQVARGQGRAPAATDWIAVPLPVFQAMLEVLGEEGFFR